MKVQNCNNSPNFGILKSTNCLGQFEGKYGEKVINALKEVPEFQKLTKLIDVDVSIYDDISEYRYVYGYEDWQRTLDCHLEISYDKKLSGIKKFIANMLGTTKSYIHNMTFDVGKTQLSDTIVDKFISSFYVNPIAPSSLRCKLNCAIEEISKKLTPKY